MTDDQYKKIVTEMQDYVDEAFHKNINGNLSELSKIIKSIYAASALQVKNNAGMGEKLDTHLTKFQEYVERDEAWKKENEPYLKGIRSLTDGSKIIQRAAMFISAVGGAWFLIKTLLK